MSKFCRRLSVDERQDRGPLYIAGGDSTQSTSQGVSALRFAQEQLSVPRKVMD